MGIFSTILNVAGTFVGDPALGNQIAGQASPGYAAITQDAQGIADTVTPDVLVQLHNPISGIDIDKPSQAVAGSAVQAIAQDLAAQGYYFAPGTLGAELQRPSLFDAFGGKYRDLVKLGAIGLGVAVALKTLI